jgi:3-hydroxyacyl-CoA dehydrogenase/enoyl-CoA hydratase/3-hydroxybutyryl-CoA epimerase/enoyl-CoA isomerase
VFNGECVRVFPLEGEFVELCFDRRGEAINKLDDRTVDELKRAVDAIRAAPALRGVLVTSAKDVFVVGADITELPALFQEPAERITAIVLLKNQIVIDLEDLTVPTVAAINGYALGGGLEVALAAAARVMSTAAQVGVPEVKLGLFPGLGGTVRLSRVAGPAVAAEWVVSGAPAGAEKARAAGVVDEVAEPGRLRETALALLRRAAAGEVDWRASQQRKRVPVALPTGERKVIFDGALAKIAASGPKHQPAARTAVEMMARAADLDRTEALALEAETFGRMSRTQAAASLVRTFLNEQALKKLGRAHARAARKVERAAVLGAGIMGGGISFASAARGVPVRMKDISQQQLDLGMSEAAKLLAKQVKGGRLTPQAADAIRVAITPQLDEAGLEGVDVVVEAIVENLEVKRKVLAALEAKVSPRAVIATNTSSLRIDDIGAPLTRPGNFVGMHFFNPVPVMPLVEVIRGSRTSEEALSTAVGYALAMGKTPVVVAKDCPGFLVNRVLTPYVAAFIQLVAEGADFEEVDRVLEAFGWPMGPAYLQDVIGMDTGKHVFDVIAAGYPDRIRLPGRNALALMVQHGRLGQKSGAGFYRYDPDPTGKPRKASDPEARQLVATIQPKEASSFAGSEVVERLMLPLVLEAIRALEEGVVGTPAELDMALLLGIGFPAYLGGALAYADWLGLKELLARAEAHAALGPAYEAPALLRELAAAGKRFYPV